MTRLIASVLIVYAAMAVGCVSDVTAPAHPRGTSLPKSVEHNTSPASGTVYQLGDYALYVPISEPRAIIVAIGSRNTKGFVSGESFGVPFPPAEAALQDLGASLRALADEESVAILGTSLGDMANDARSDQMIMDAIALGAQTSGQSKLATAPILLFGLFGGGPEASGFAARYPERVAGLLMKVPFSVTMLTTEAQRQVPTFIVLAGLEVFVDNVALGQAFAANRSSGALWAMATEPGVRHEAFTPTFRTTAITWMRSVLNRRVAGSANQLHLTPEASGWLGETSTGTILPWGRYHGNRSSANWFATQEDAEQWRALIGAATVSIPTTNSLRH